MSEQQIYKGNILYTPTPEKFSVFQNGYIVVKDGKVAQVTAELPLNADRQTVRDFGECLIIPAFNDLHLHAPQFPLAGLGFDYELLPWLEKYTFKAEAIYQDVGLARELYAAFLQKMWLVGTLRFSAFATIHKDSTLALMEMCWQSGLRGFIGKVNMDRNSPSSLIENRMDSIRDTEEYLERSSDFAPYVCPIITPRFVPSTTPALMSKLGEIAERHDLRVQSHLSENISEIEWVKSLHPQAASYADVYLEHGLLRPGKTIMAHCVYLVPEEIELLQERNIFIAHCAQSNADLSSGIMPLRRWMNSGLHCVIASDVAGSHEPNMNRHIVATIEASKIWRMEHPEDAAVSLPEAFYLATKASGSFFGDVGSFERGYDFDALVIEDAPNPLSLSAVERLERFIYTGDDRSIIHRFVAGKELDCPLNTIRL